jgi:hypothetical protein
MTFSYICTMKKNRTFFHQYFCADFESPDQYIVIIEVEDEVPLKVFLVKIPRIYPIFTINPYLIN